MSNQKTHPAAVEINGVPYIHDAQGNLVPLANVKSVHLLEDEMVRKIVVYGEDLSAELARYSTHTDADIAAFDALLAQEYNVEPRETKGNRTFTSFDGLLRVQVAVAQRIKMGPALDDAKAVLDAMIRERGEGVDPFLITLVKRAFKTDQEGKVDVRAILALRRLEVDDPRWPDFCRAIDDAVQPDGSKRYTRLYRRQTIQDGWQMIPLDLAAVQPTPAALERKSLRRQVEELTGKITRIAKLLFAARHYAEDGAMATMLSKLDMARELAGEKESPTDLTVPGLDGATAPSYVRLWLSSLPPKLLVETLGDDIASAIQTKLGGLSQAAE